MRPVHEDGRSPQLVPLRDARRKAPAGPRFPSGERLDELPELGVAGPAMTRALDGARGVDEDLDAHPTPPRVDDEGRVPHGTVDEQRVVAGDHPREHHRSLAEEAL